MIEGIVFGMMLAMMVYNLMIYFFIKEVVYLYYVIYLFLLMVFFWGWFEFLDTSFYLFVMIQTVVFSWLLAYKIKLLEKEKEAKGRLLVDQNRLTSMGEMISSIAHQWRQPLSEINGRVLNIDMDYRKKKLTKNKIEKHLNGIEEITDYLSGTIDDFMSFFDTNKELESFMISEVIDDAIRIAYISSSKNISITTDIEEDISLFGYKSELIQALLIVIHNSVDACSREEIEFPKITMVVDDEGDDLKITIKDNGGGIPKDILPSIFDPYFSTKYQSQGTGLGLYILKMIIERSMQGVVEIKNHHKGVECTIQIPKKVSVKVGKSNKLK